MRKKIALGIIALGLLAVVGTAMAGTFDIRVRAGNLILDAQGGFEPTALPKYKDAPITTHGGGKISTTTGDLPPILDKFILEFDRHGELDATGLPVCTTQKLVATTVAAARRACGDAIVGEGFGRAVVKFPEQGPIDVGSPITIFNGPKSGGDITIIAHAHLDYPGPTTFIVPIVIEKVKNGIYGYRVNVKIPKIAGGYGHPISGHAKVGRKWTYKGERHSFLNAHCGNGRFRARGEFTFKEGPEESVIALADVGQVLKANFFLPCKVRK